MALISVSETTCTSLASLPIWTSYNAVDPSSERATVAADPVESMWDDGVEGMARFAYQNPLISHYATTGDGSALRISDFISRRQLHRTDLYDLVYRHLELEYQLAVTVPSPQRTLGRPGEVVGLTLSRSRRDFSNGEMLLLESLRPHFAAALERLHEVALLREPKPLSADVDRSGTADGATLAHEGVRLRVRLVRDAYPALDAVHLTPLGGLPGPEALRSLMLTPAKRRFSRWRSAVVRALI